MFSVPQNRLVYLIFNHKHSLHTTYEWYGSKICISENFEEKEKTDF
jgi:hypothetical protein